MVALLLETLYSEKTIRAQAASSTIKAKVISFLSVILFSRNYTLMRQGQNFMAQAKIPQTRLLQSGKEPGGN
ncbi:hypothetical protein LJC36_01780 [Desulfovibrio sp. OttesenSCG-928-C14]|nr:hypothetical protein [Desulfovibrio sp. OttesenSCG-928-C14]